MLPATAQSQSVFTLSEQPFKFKKVEIDGEEWKNIQKLLEERERLLLTKGVFIETSQRYYDGRYIPKTVCKTMSEDELLKKIEELYGLLEEERTQFGGEIEAIKTRTEEKYRGAIDTLQKKLKKSLDRGLWARIINREPAVDAQETQQ